LYENKGSALAKTRNEATAGKSSVFGYRLSVPCEGHFSTARKCRSGNSGLKTENRKQDHIKNEGISHDVIENKAAENGILEYPTMFMITNELFLMRHDVYEKYST